MSLSRFAIAAAVVTAVGSAASPPPNTGSISGCTPTKGTDSKGIYRSKFDDATGKLSRPELAAEMDSPSFITIHPNKKFLYARSARATVRTADRSLRSRLDAKTGALVRS